MSNDLVGQSKYGEERVQKNSFKIVEGDGNVYRILPPFGSKRGSGHWKVYESVHWGYGVTKDGKFRHRPFKCVAERDRSGKVMTVCPACTHIAKLKADLEAAQKQYEGKPPEQIKELTRPIVESLTRFNLDKKWHLNVLSLDGKIGRLMIGHKAKLALDVEIKKMIGSGECTDPCGRGLGPFFVFSKVKGASFQDTMHTVTPFNETEVINGKRMRTVKYVEVTDDVVERMKTEAWDLGELYVKLSVDDVRRLVESGGDPDIANAIFNKREAIRPERPEATPAKVAPAVTSSANNEEAELLAKLEAVRRKNALQASSMFTENELDEDERPTPQKTVSNEDFKRLFGG